MCMVPINSHVSFFFLIFYSLFKNQEIKVTQLSRRGLGAGASPSR